MKAVGLKLPDALSEDELLSLPATWEEYSDLVDEAPYTVQFLNGEIIMSQATDEWLNHDYRTLDSIVKMGNLELPMKDIYRKIVFDS